MSLHAKLMIPPLAASLGWAAYLLLAWLPDYAAEPAEASASLMPALLLWLALTGLLAWAGAAMLQHRLHRLAQRAGEAGKLPPVPAGGDALAHCAQQVDALLLKLQEAQAAHTRIANRYRQCEENLRESEERYVIAIRGANDGTMEWDIADGDMLFSPRWKSMLGLEEAHVDSNIGEWYSRIHADDYDRTRAAVQHLLDGRASLFENEHRLRHGNGEYLWVAARGVAIRSASGKAMKFIAALTDITEKKLAQQLLSQVEDGLDAVSGDEFFRRLVRNMARAFNAKYAFITECLNGPDGKPNRVRTIAFWAEEGFVENIEYDLQGTPCQEVIEDGTTCFYPMGLAKHYPQDVGLESYVGIAVPGPAGQAVGHLACLDPVPMRSNLPIQSVQKLFAMRASTEIMRMTLEKSLQVSQQTHRAVCDNVDELVLLASPVGRLESFNRAAAETLGLGRDGTPGRSLQDMLLPKGETTHATLDALIAAADGECARHCCLIDAQGRMREATGVVAAIHDSHHRLEKVVVVARLT